MLINVENYRLQYVLFMRYLTLFFLRLLLGLIKNVQLKKMWQVFWSCLPFYLEAFSNKKIPSLIINKKQHPLF